jgi:hypothetical protein
MDREGLAELFAEFGPVSVRRMFGGAGIWADSTMFALIVDDIIYLKADEQIIRTSNASIWGPSSTQPRAVRAPCGLIGECRIDSMTIPRHWPIGHDGPLPQRTARPSRGGHQSSADAGID